eukprot:357665-Chlamydomonas_euryale.AAC.3
MRSFGGKGGYKIIWWKRGAYEIIWWCFVWVADFYAIDPRQRAYAGVGGHKVGKKRHPISSPAASMEGANISEQQSLNAGRRSFSGLMSYLSTSCSRRHRKCEHTHRCSPTATPSDLRQQRP